MHAVSIISALGLVASANAHIIMSTPKGWTVNSSPLLADGSDFPCKGVSYDSSVSANEMTKGDSQPLSFIGSAVHGGGSCQISLTTDLQPTKDSKWKVIKSFVGGCPAQGVDGNLPADPTAKVPFDYDFAIPDDIPAGKYTLAWTWFNKIGNREMYMNCAPINAVGSGGDESAFEALPDMFTANIGNGCGTSEGADVAFPNAGEVVEKLGSGSTAPPTGSCGSSSSKRSVASANTGASDCDTDAEGSYESSSNSTESQPTESQSAASQSTQSQSTQSQPTQSQSTEAQPTESQVTEGSYEEVSTESPDTEGSYEGGSNSTESPDTEGSYEGASNSTGSHNGTESCNSTGSYNNTSAGHKRWGGKARIHSRFFS